MTKKNIFSPAFFISLILIFSTFLLTGCGDKEEVDDYGNIMLESDYRLAIDEEMPDPTLAAGQILLVRLIYNVDEEDSSDTEWYKVQLSREGKHWKDSVKIEGIIRSKNRHYDDYTFGSKNFNWQIKREEYDIDTLDGYYTIDIQGSNGYYNTHRLHWADGKWTNASPILIFSVR